MDVFTPYALTTSAYLTLQSLPLLLTPSLIAPLLTRDDPRRPTDAETYLCRALGLALLCLAAAILPLTGILPVATKPPPQRDDAQGDGDTEVQSNPYAFPTLVTTTTYHAASAFYLYAQLASKRTWPFAFVTGMTASAGLGCLGLWVLMFGGERGSVSRRTGADRRTGNFPFVNSESSREKRKEAKMGSGRRSVARGKA